MVRIYLPADANTVISTVDHCLQSKAYVNLVVSSKQDVPVWLSMEEAVEHCRAGASIWKFASTFDGEDPDVVLVGCGCEVTFEAIAAASLLKRDVPGMRVRVVNVTDLMVLSATGGHPHALSDEKFDTLFTKSKPIVFNFHGYPSVIRGLCFDRPDIHGRMRVHGYMEEGTTTTPFKMLTCNGCSRFDLAMDALERFQPRDDLKVDTQSIIAKYKQALKEHDEFIVREGKDPEWCAAWDMEGSGRQGGKNGGVLFE
ncbi:hypothetical protein HK104_007653 [Borealophlyctis nickersoniae]|nr:hypothetical protein HK104_007653 [Borealophlyctis nickersoniae]